MTSLDSILKSRGISFLTKDHLVKAMVFPIVMYGCESLTINKVECQSMMLLNCGVGEDSWQSLGRKEIKPVNPKWNQPWIFPGRTVAEALLLGRPDVKGWLIGKNPDAGKDWRQEKGTTEDEMVGWYPWLNGHESKQTPGDDEGQGSLACCSPWGCKELDTTELDWTHTCFKI